jgi:hypothetical protein
MGEISLPIPRADFQGDGGRFMPIVLAYAGLIPANSFILDENSP